ncbi:MAG: DUF2235 domain-containing protein [bacterium]|nr:DUF2235 domain-containing protein [bacterium]
MSMKKLAVFFDGTWNSSDQHTEKEQPCPTNMAKLFEATQPNSAQNEVPQIVHYIQGVGTHKLERIRGGGFGFGISDNIKEGYKCLVSNYEKGDEVFIFGFSRGAYSARSLAGLIRNVGILKREKLYLINKAYEGYKNRSMEWAPKGSKAISFRQNNTWGDETIKFLGVFDTVGALGAPFGIVVGWIVDKLFRCSFHDTQLSSIVENAYHALSIDERRLPFLPTLMTPNTRHDPSHFEQKWFPGVHSDVGGGYSTTGLSDLALAWIANKAIENGLNLNLNLITNPSFAPNVNAEPNNSQSLFYRIASVLFVKLPSYIGVVPNKYKSALPSIQWNGDYIRPLPNLGNVAPFIGSSPKNKNTDQYFGDLHVCVIDKINQCWNQYLPPNVTQ